MGLCGVFACCISGFVTSHYFSNKVQTTKCVYERVYYDSKYGEIKKNITKWEGLEEINRQAIIKKFEEFLYINKTDNYVLPFDFDKNEWNEGDKKLLLDPKVYYKKSFQDQLKNDIIKKCIQYPGSIRDLKGELICDSNLTDHNSFIYEYSK